MTNDSSQISQLLEQWSKGDDAALEELTPLVYGQLKQLAHHYLRQERPDHTLQTTALVHEAFVRLVEATDIRWQRRAQFYAVAARLMRRILVDYARTRNRLKRGGTQIRVPLEDVVVVSFDRSDQIIALDDALTKLALEDDRTHKVMELRAFGGLNNEEIAEVLGISANTVGRDWKLGKAWLARELSRPSN
jgi:RNA polymerase sigma factor (TIGR02999 family)